MYSATAMESGQPPVVVDLAEVARDGRLVIFAGAGLSRANPTSIPDGSEIARRCHGRLVDLLGPDALEGADIQDLISVADAVADCAPNLNLVRNTAVGLADFTSAQPNFSHEVLALLLLEGVIVVITTNWDDCIERAGGSERIHAVISDRDLQEIRGPVVLKVHGCATRPTTLLITSEDLATPAQWARDEVNSRLSDSYIVFLGIGSIADYVRARVKEAAGAVGTPSATFVVAPDLGHNWSSSEWAELLPSLPEDHRIATSSDEFLDNLAAAYLRRVMRGFKEDLIDEPSTARLFQHVREAFEKQTSLQALQWLRSCAVPRTASTSVTQHQAFLKALLALSSLSQGRDIQFCFKSRATVESVQYDVLVAVGTVTTSRLRREARARLVQLRSESNAAIDSPIYLLSGGLGPINITEELPSDIVDEADARDVVGGPVAEIPAVIFAESYVT